MPTLSIYTNFRYLNQVGKIEKSTQSFYEYTWSTLEEIMKIAIICANGKAGRLITKEAVERGEDVTVFVRGENKSIATKAVQKDLFKITKEDLTGYDVVIDAFGAWTAETIPEIPKAVEHLCDVLKGSNTRLLVVGGAGSLYTNKEHTATLDSGENFPDAFKPLAKAHGEALSF